MTKTLGVLVTKVMVSDADLITLSNCRISDYRGPVISVKFKLEILSDGI